MFAQSRWAQQASCRKVQCIVHSLVEWKISHTEVRRESCFVICTNLSDASIIFCRTGTWKCKNKAAWIKHIRGSPLIGKQYVSSNPSDRICYTNYHQKLRLRQCAGRLNVGKQTCVFGKSGSTAEISAHITFWKQWIFIITVFTTIVGTECIGTTIFEADITGRARCLL